MTAKKRSIVLDHLCRVEGLGGIHVEIKNGKPTKIQMDIFEGTRFFESLVVGHSCMEVPHIVSRVCAICSAVHTLTSINAIEDAFGIKVTYQTELLRELLLHGGNIESHALHLYCLAFPDFLGYNGVLTLAADHPNEVKMGLELKKLGNAIQETIGGRAVHPVNAVVGGFGKIPSEKQLKVLRGKLQKGLELAISTIEIVNTLTIANFSESPTVYAALAPNNGIFSLEGDNIIVSTGDVLEKHNYKELCNETVVSYSHAKHSHFKEKPFMVGALARMMLNGDKLKGKARMAAKQLGLDKPTENILLNNSAQAVEIVWSLERSIEIIDELLSMGIKEEQPLEYSVKASTGTGAIEAPRGTLYHSYVIADDGRITEADIITPTAQNYANVEKDFHATIDKCGDESEDQLTLKLEMVARAYDPCISCSVHLVDVTYA